ncbi:MAG TPA: cysteine-rich CWC family protein [Myxococcota bacterium]|nr:cysteine-rich CWC family protein [Myxococcota bacterium]
MSEVASADGARLYYEHHVPTRTTGATVIFTCAYCTTHENWRGQIDKLLDAGHPVVLWDLRGHGLSESPTGPDAYSIERVVEDLDAVAAATTPDRPFVAAGLSFGGLASQHYALRHRGRVAGLVLIGSGPGFKNPEAAAGWAAQVERTARFLETRGFEDFVNGKAGITCVGRRPELPAARAAARAIVAQSVPGVARFGREVSGPAPSTIDELPGLDVPALVMVGELDAPFLRAAEVMAAKLPNARHVVVPDAGHIVNIEQAERFDTELLGFLGALEGDRCPLCGEPNACAIAAVGGSGASAARGSSGEPCWCVDARFPESLVQRATAVDGGRRCICRRCLEAAT